MISESDAGARGSEAAARLAVPSQGAASLPEDLASALGICAPAARVLCARGLSEPEAARRFLSPAASDLHDPYLLKDMDRAAPRLARAIEQRESILLYGDYDVDGTTALVVLKKAIDLAGGNATCFVPHRLPDQSPFSTPPVRWSRPRRSRRR